MTHHEDMTTRQILREGGVVVATATLLSSCGTADNSESVRGKAPAMSVDCSPYNAGSPDYVAGSGESADPLELAKRWSADRYSGSKPRLTSADDRDAFVVVDQPDGPREAVLHYRDDGNGWYLDNLVYC